MVNINQQERLCPHTVRTAFLHLPPFFFLSLALSALMLLKAKQNTGYGCKECWFSGMLPWILLPVASHGKRVQPPVSVAGWSPWAGQKEDRCEPLLLPTPSHPL